MIRRQSVLDPDTKETWIQDVDSDGNIIGKSRIRVITVSLESHYITLGIYGYKATNNHNIWEKVL